MSPDLPTDPIAKLSLPSLGTWGTFCSLPLPVLPCQTSNFFWSMKNSCGFASLSPTAKFYPAFEKPTSINPTSLVWYLIWQARGIPSVEVTGIFKKDC